MPKSQVAADTKKGAVVKANVSKAPAKPAVTKAAGEPAKKAGMPSELSARTHAAKSVVAKKAPLPASSPAAARQNALFRPRRQDALRTAPDRQSSGTPGSLATLLRSRGRCAG